MGVLNTQDRERRDLFLCSFLSDDETFPVNEDTTTTGSTPPIYRRKCQTSSKASRAPRPQSYIKNTGRKARGGKNSRRFENFVFLSNLIDPDELEDLVITDFVVKSGSAFDLLFEDEAEMNKWTEFMSKNDEEQESYLQELTCASISKCSSKSKTISGNRQWHNDSDLKRAAKRFQNVDNRIKTTLKHRNVSMVGLKFFEEEVLSFFTHIEDGVLVFLIPSSMDRLLVHGICQYLNLTSLSHPRLVIQVENTRDEFCPPAVPLSQYLQHIR